MVKCPILRLKRPKIWLFIYFGKFVWYNFCIENIFGGFMANSLIEQFKTYVKFKDLSERAGQVFTTVESYNAFMTQMQNSYQQGYELSDFEFALTLLESIQEENAATITTKKVDDKLQIKANVVPEEDETSTDETSLQKTKGKYQRQVKANL